MLKSVSPFTICAAAAGAVMLIISGPYLKAQEPQPEEFPALNTERGQAYLRALTDRLPYVPGDILVKFREGAGMVARTRAMSVMRTGLDTQAVYVGEALLAHSSDEPNPEALAMMLRRQPEVEWAQPNYIAPLRSVPNDPGFSEQWNFELMNLPKAWEINPGGNASVLVAVIDTGANTDLGNEPRSGSGRVDVLKMFPCRLLQIQKCLQAALMQGRDFTILADPFATWTATGLMSPARCCKRRTTVLGLAGVAYNARLLPLKACRRILGYSNLLRSGWHSRFRG